MAAVRASELYSAILSENASIIVNIAKEYGTNSIIDGAKSKPSKGLAILPLHLAASYRKVHSIESLLLAGANPGIRDQQGRNALHLVITHWPYIHATWPASQSRFQTAMVSMQKRAEACLQVLCNHGVDLNTVVDSGSRQTAMHLAVRFAALSAIHILASHGAAVNTTDLYGMTPLHMAASMLNTEIAVCLIKLGADVNKVVSHSGNRPLHLAALTTAFRPEKNMDTALRCITELLDQGAEVDAVNNAGRTALHEACSVGKEAVVNLLLRRGADINKQTPAGENGLFLFLDHRPNLCHTSLLGRLLSLTSPLTIANGAGLQPSTLLLPQYSRQREQILALTRHPRSLMDICRIQAFQYYGSGSSRRQTLADLLPERLHRYVLWGSSCDISFVSDDDKAKSGSWSDFFHREEPERANSLDVPAPERQRASEH
ncbi:ankyrin repeat domain-containing protein 61-like [Osmerus mordax]|uniref:ankyrin repeat domain-containing protein 61-like n=1 Tax=Osmerus mordax TaxID=8014 RepID=UPI00350F94F0